MSTLENERVAAESLAATQQASETIRLDAWRAVFEKTNRIVSGSPLRVKIVSADEIGSAMAKVPGWSDGEVINFNGPIVLDMLRMKDALGAVLRLKGLNYHELAHCLFTPRASEELPKKVIERANAEHDSLWWAALNALEDQRIETWFTAMFGPSRRYFEAAVLQWLITDGNAEAAILLHGRKFLSPSIRVQAAKVFRKKYPGDLMDRFEAVIDEYLSVMLPKDSLRAFMLVGRFHALVKEMQGAGGAGLPNGPVQDNGCHTGHGTPSKDDPGVVRKGKIGQADAKQARDLAKKMADDAAKADAEAKAQAEAERQADEGTDPKPGADPKPDTDPTEAEKADGGEAAADGPEGEQAESGGEMPGADGGGPGSGAEGESEGESAGAGQPTDGGEASTPGDQPGEAGEGDGEVGDGIGDGAGSDSAGPPQVSEADLIEAIKDLIDEANAGMDDIQADAEVVEDVRQVLDAVKAVVNNGRQDAAGDISQQRGNTAARTEDKVASRRVRDLLTRIHQEAEPTIMRRQDAGRIDVRRLIARRPNETDIFTTYDEGSEDEAGMEVVVLLDVSGSMGGCIGEASAAVWALKRAFDSQSIRCTVMTYDTEHYVLYQPSQKAGPRVTQLESMGGTDPTSALQQAFTIFGKSSQPNKVLITITDGQWGGNEEARKGLMRNMHRMGVTTMLLGLNKAEKKHGRHDHLIGHDLDSVSALPKAVLKLVGMLMRNATGQV